MSKLIISKPAINNCKLLTDTEVRTIGKTLSHVKPRYFRGLRKGGNYKAIEDQIIKDLDGCIAPETFEKRR